MFDVVHDQSERVFRATKSSEVERIAFVVLDGFSNIALSAAIEPLRLANYVSGRTLFEWTTHAINAQPVMASNGLRFMPDGDLAAASDAPNVMVFAGINGYVNTDTQLSNWLRSVDRKGAHVGAGCTGSFVLADAGLLDGLTCAVHWEYRDAFSERYPNTYLSDGMFTADGRYFTCAGGTSAIDLMLVHIRAAYGRALAQDVASRMYHNGIRKEGQEDFAPLKVQMGIMNDKVARATRAMEENMEPILTLDEVAERVGITSRQLQRLFLECLDTTPMKFYKELRLKRARRLLQQTDMSIIEISLACGFVTPSHFTYRYRDYFGYAPRRERALAA